MRIQDLDLLETTKAVRVSLNCICKIVYSARTAQQQQEYPNLCSSLAVPIELTAAKEDALSHYADGALAQSLALCQKRTASSVLAVYS
jgi:hypothetical protein